MGHYELVCKQCFTVLSNPAFDRAESIIASCANKKCPYKVVYKVPSTRPKIKKGKRKRNGKTGKH